ncbi:hypothetical protein B5S28_g4087 [[Candida] boidinii]|nr:hypothetical protein B5S28_g4087 [[Candida] boidinii]
MALAGDQRTTRHTETERETREQERTREQEKQTQRNTVSPQQAQQGEEARPTRQSSTSHLCANTSITNTGRVATTTFSMSSSRWLMSSTVSTTPSSTLIDSKWDLVLSNAIVKTGLGFGAGVLASVLVFRRRSFPVWIGVGFGLGRAYAEGDSIFRSSGLREIKA